MSGESDHQLLCDYIEHQSEIAFSELVRRHVDFVYSAALRMVRDPHLAEDVTQAVFMALAQNAQRLTEHPLLSGWLHRTTQNLAAKTIRSDVRRRAREEEAAAMNELVNGEAHDLWEKVAPHLDNALGELSESDRDALLLRYFQRKSAREMAETLGTTEDAAQKRVSRAIERIRELFAKQGVAVGASGLALALSTHAIQAAPTGLSASISAAGTLGNASSAGIKWLSAKMLAGMVAGALVVGSAAYVVQQARSARMPALLAAAAPDLSSARTVHGIVKTPEGKPLPGADVYLATASITLPVYSAPSFKGVSTQTDKDGGFTFAADPDNRAVIVVSEEGYAQRTVAELATRQELSLQPWAHIGGTLRQGAKVLGNQTIHLSRSRFGSKIEQQSFRTVHDAVTKTDADGRYLFSRVAPGDTWISWRAGADRYDVQYRYVDVAPGQSLTVDIGGRGRPITGRAVLAEEGEAEGKLYGSVWPRTFHQIRRPADWNEMSPDEQEAFVAAWEKTPDAKIYNQERCPIDFRIAPDGRFTVPDLPAGAYGVTVAAWTGAPVKSKMISRGNVQITIPEMPGSRSDEPLDIGVISAISRLPLRPDDPAPPFEGVTFNGKPVKLADYKGKHVLIHFWRSDRAETHEDIEQFKAAQAAWSTDKRFVLLGLNFDNTLSEAQKFAAENKLTWTQCFMGANSEVPAKYRLRGPKAILIGPDGVILDPDLAGPGIATALQEALGTK